MFRLERALHFVSQVLWVIISSPLPVLVLSFLAQILARPDELPGVLDTREFWVRVALGVVPVLLAINTAFLLAGRFLRAVYPKLRTEEAIRFLLYSRFGRPSFGPWMKIQGGKITMPENSVLTRLGGPGALIVGGDNAVVLERGGVFTSVQGPGFPQLGPFEKVYDIIQLGPESYRYPVSAMSREGIVLDWDVEVQYQIADGGQPLKDGAFYPLSPDDVFRASTSKWIREEGWKDGQDMDWEDIIVSFRADSTLRNILARRRLDELIGLTEGEAQAVRIALQNELEEDLSAFAPSVGAKILRVRLDSLRVRDEVAKQWIEAWKARWQSWSAERLAVGEAANIFQHEKVKVQAETVFDICQALETLVDDRSSSEQDLPGRFLLRLISVLERAAHAAPLMSFFPAQTMEVLEAFRLSIGSLEWNESEEVEIDDITSARKCLAACFRPEDLYRHIVDSRLLYKELKLHIRRDYNMEQLLDAILDHPNRSALLTELLRLAEVENPRAFEPYRARLARAIM